MVPLRRPTKRFRCSRRGRSFWALQRLLSGAITASSKLGLLNLVEMILAGLDALGLGLPLLTLLVERLLVQLAPFPVVPHRGTDRLPARHPLPLAHGAGSASPCWLAIVMVTLFTIGALALAGVTLVPLLIDQLGQLINALPPADVV